MGLNPSPSTRGAFQINGTPLTPQDAIHLLMDDVRTLVTENLLSQGQADGLMSKLTAAIQSLNGGGANAACNQLRAFVNQVDAFINAGTLSEGRSSADRYRRKRSDPDRLRIGREQLSRCSETGCGNLARGCVRRYRAHRAPSPGSQPGKLTT